MDDHGSSDVNQFGALQGREGGTRPHFAKSVSIFDETAEDSGFRTRILFLLYALVEK
jgi:hypothetical protein